MKVLLVCVKLNGGGAERVGVLMANSLADRGHQVSIVSNLYEPVIYDVDKRISIHSMNPNTTNEYKKWSAAIINIRKEIRREKPDIIVGIMYLCSLAAKIASIGTGIPVVMTEHNSFERPESAPFKKKDLFFKFKVNKIYDYVTVLTEADKKIIGNRLKRVEVMPNPLLLKPYYEEHHREKRLIAAGRVDAWHYKGFDILVKAWNQIYHKYPEWRLEIAGLCDRPRNYLRIVNLIQDFKIEERTKLLGYRTDVEQLYRDSEIFVLSSRYEGFGLVLIEAMSQGCAPIACDYKGRQKEILKETNQLETHPSPPCLGREPNSAESSIKNSSLNREDFQKAGIEICENGILCEPENVEALAQAMDKMISDEDYRRKVQQNAVKRTEFYNLERTGERWEKFLEKVIKLKHS